MTRGAKASSQRADTARPTLGILVNLGLLGKDTFSITSNSTMFELTRS